MIKATIVTVFIIFIIIQIHEICGAGSSRDCFLPIEVGSCHYSIRRWAWSPSVQVCVPFTYSGCKGNENNFFSRRECDYQCRDLEMGGILHSWIYVLSRQGIKAQHLLLTETWKILQYYKRVSQPLFVVLLHNRQSMVDFSKFTRHMNMSFPIWLIIFLRTFKNDGENYCQSPPNNIFNIGYRTEMIVVCNDDDIVRQWYFKDSQIEVLDLGVWRYESGFVKFSNQSAHEKRYNMGGITLRAITVKYDKVASMKNGKWIGFFGKIMEELCQMANFTLKTTEVTKYGGWYENGTWTGAIGEVILGHADIGIADFSITTERLNVVDFTLPLMVSDVCLFIREPDTFSIRWFAYFQTFSSKIWLTIVFILFTTPFMLAFIKTRVRSQEFFRSLYDNYLYVWGIFCQQGLSEFPPSFSARLAYFSLFISALVISAAYSAALISFLTIHSKALPFRSLKEFVEDGTYKLLVVRATVDFDNFASGSDPLTIKAMSMMESWDELPLSRAQAISRVCTENKVAFYTSSGTLHLNAFNMLCKVTCIRAGGVDSSGFILHKNSPYTTILNRHLQKLLNNGMLHRIKGKNFKKEFREEKTYDAVCFDSFLPILSIFVGGLILSLFLFIIEKVIFIILSKM